MSWKLHGPADWSTSRSLLLYDEDKLFFLSNVKDIFKQTQMTKEYALDFEREDGLICTVKTSVILHAAFSTLNYWMLFGCFALRDRLNMSSQECASFTSVVWFTNQFTPPLWCTICYRHFFFALNLCDTSLFFNITVLNVIPLLQN